MAHENTPAGRVDSGMSSPAEGRRYDAFVITAPGLEALAAAELVELGVRDARAIDGGASFTATRRALYDANLHLRTASRVVVRAAEFTAKAFHELERRAGKVPWEAFVSPNLPVSLRVTCRKSRLYHSDAVAQRVASALMSRIAGARIAELEEADESGPAIAEPDERETPHQLILVRLLHDRCTVSIDSSGALLHLRGYRQAVAKAPMRETLAAATLIASGWDGRAPLLDPMCGSGTICIEGAMISRRMAPGLRRQFAFQSWPDFDSREWDATLAAAQGRVLDRSPVRIQGSDRDAGAIEAASANAARAGVADDLELIQRPISAIDPPAEPGWLVSNPPYGFRVGEADRLRNLYAQLGNVARAKCPGWRVALLSADPGLERQLRLDMKPVLRTSNGGITVRVVAGQVPADSHHPEIAEQATDTAPARRYPS
jgi:putative N6-adenine-specific DNA methylase